MNLEETLILIRTPKIGPKRYFSLLQEYGSLDEILKYKSSEFHFATLETVQKEIKLVQKFGAEFVTYYDENYPLNLKNISDPPVVLTVKGNKDLLKKSGLGIVGARNASSTGKLIAGKIAKNISEEGYVIVSGLARGIDTSAHKGAINNGTIGVIGNGIDVFYPEENKDLQMEIFEKGLVVSEFAFGSAPQTQNFPIRNRIISSLSKGVLVVEAALKSGSLITAHLALEQGKEVMAVPGSPLDPRCLGTNQLLKQGATLVENFEDVLSVFGELETPKTPIRKSIFYQKKTQESEKPLEYSKQSVLDNLSYVPILIDHLIDDANVAPNLLQSFLLELEIEEKIERHPGNKVALKIKE